MSNFSGVWNLVQQMQAVAAGNWPLPPLPGDIGLFAGSSNSISYINIATTGNAAAFGSLTTSRSYAASCASSTRGVFAGSYAANNTIDYVTINTLGNAANFGSLPYSTWGAGGGCSNETRGLFGGGNFGSPTANINYITIASTGNTTSFGNLNLTLFFLSGCSSSTRGLFAGGRTTAANIDPTNVIDYVTIATTGNATDFGDLTVARRTLTGCSSSTRGLFAGGDDSGATTVNTIDYVTIASTGNATDFGDLTVARNGLAACSSSTRGTFGGGSGPSNVIDYVTIASAGNAIDFGDLLAATLGLTACSNAHGGL